MPPPSRASCSGAWAWLLLGILGHASQGCFAVVPRRTILDSARERIDVWYADPSHTGDAKEKDGIRWRLSKEDKDCGGSGVPLTFMEFDITSDDGDAPVRPVDVFNVVAPLRAWPQWDKVCKKAILIEEAQEEQTQGWALLYKYLGATLEVFGWVAMDANFSSEEFWVAETSLETDDLRQARSPEPGASVKQECLFAMRFTRTPTGVHVVSTSQLNPQLPLVSPRAVAEYEWSSGVDVDRVKTLVAKSRAQARLRWNATEVVVPKWMIADRPCGPPKASTALREQHLNAAAEEMRRPEGELGHKLPDMYLGGKEKLEVWRSDEVCGGGGGNLSTAAATVRRWRARFRVPGASPGQVFNVLANRAAEVSWNRSLLARVNITGFYRGTRGLHESYRLPRVARPRELWEWQAANHSLATGTYLLAVASAGAPSTEKFTPGAVVGMRCLAAFEVSRGEGGSTLVRMSDQFDPRRVWLYGLMMGPSLIKDFAEAVTSEAVALGLPGSVVDSDVLQLLAPPPLERNLSITMDDVLAADRAAARTRLFAGLYLPRELNSSSWAPGSFEAKAAGVLRLFQAFAANASANEAAPFSKGPAIDALALQLQGEALQAIQQRIFDALSQMACNGTLPDINNNKAEKGLSLGYLVLLLSLAVPLALAALLLPCCCLWRRTRRRGNLRVAAAAAALLAAAPGAAHGEDAAAGGQGS